MGAKEGRGDWQFIRGLKAELPGQSLWYSKAAFDHLVVEQIQQALDPDYANAWKRMDKWDDEQGTQRWWDQGELTPGRAPDFGAVFGAAQGDDLDAALAALEGKTIQ